MRLVLGALAALGWFAAGHLLLAKLYRPAPAGKPATVTMLTSLPLRWATGGGLAAMIAQGAGEDPALLRLDAPGPEPLVDSLAHHAPPPRDPLLLAPPPPLAPHTPLETDSSVGGGRATPLPARPATR